MYFRSYKKLSNQINHQQLPDEYVLHNVFAIDQLLIAIMPLVALNNNISE